MLRDVLAKLPGIDPQNMNILGKAIARTYINDRLIFGDNPQDAMKYLSGREIINISVYDEDSPEDRGRKFKRKEKERVINVKTRHRIDFVYAGHATASYGRNMKNAGDGSDNRYTAGLVGNFFSEKLQLKANASADNTGRDSDPDRILDITGLNPDYARDMKADIEAVKKFSLPALNRLGISYGYSNAYDRYSSSSDTEYAPTNEYSLRQYSDMRRNVQQSNSHSAHLELHSDRYYTGNFHFRTSDSDYDSWNRTLSRTDDTQDYLYQKTVSESESFDFTGNITGHFPVSDRIFAIVSADGIFTQNSGTRIQADTTSAYTRQYISDPIGRSSNIKAYAELRYILKKSGSIGISYSFSSSDQRQKEFRYLNAVDEANLDRLVSNDYTYRYSTHTASGKISIGRLKVNIPVSFSRQNQDRMLPADEYIGRNYISFNPSVSLTIGNFGKQRFGTIVLMSRSRLPSIEQTNPSADISNPLFIRQGNRNLKQSTEYSLNANYQLILGGGHSLMITASASTVANMIAEDRRFFAENGHAGEMELDAGSTYITYSNISGAWNAESQIQFSTFIKPVRTSLRTVLKYNYSRTPALIDGDKIISGRHSPDLDISLSASFLKSCRISLNSGTAGTWSHSREYGNVSWIDQSVSVRSENRFAKRFFINVVWAWSLRIPLEKSTRISSNVLNAACGVYLTKDRKLALSASCYDILNRTSPFSTLVSQDFVRTSWSPFYGRFWAVGLTWKFNSTEKAD